MTSWRFGQPASTIAALGAAIAKDPDVAACQVARAWNWAMSKTDIVNDLAVVPTSTIDTFTQSFVTGGYTMRPLLKSIFTSDDFVKF